MIVARSAIANQLASPLNSHASARRVWTKQDDNRTRSSPSRCIAVQLFDRDPLRSLLHSLRITESARRLIYSTTVHSPDSFCISCRHNDELHFVFRARANQCLVAYCSLGSALLPPHAQVFKQCGDFLHRAALQQDHPPVNDLFFSPDRTK